MKITGSTGFSCEHTRRLIRFAVGIILGAGCVSSNPPRSGASTSPELNSLVDAEHMMKSKRLAALRLRQQNLRSRSANATKVVVRILPMGNCISTAGKAKKTDYLINGSAIHELVDAIEYEFVEEGHVDALPQVKIDFYSATDLVEQIGLLSTAFIRYPDTDIRLSAASSRKLAAWFKKNSIPVPVGANTNCFSNIDKQ